MDYKNIREIAVSDYDSNGEVGVKYGRRNLHNKDYVHTTTSAITIIHVLIRTGHLVSF
jgi:hypothetical protein